MLSVRSCSLNRMRVIKNPEITKKISTPTRVIVPKDFRRIAALRQVSRHYKGDGNSPLSRPGTEFVWHRQVAPMWAPAKRLFASGLLLLYRSAERAILWYNFLVIELTLII